MSSLVYSIEGDKPQWRKGIRHQAGTVRGCAKGEDAKAKDAHDTLNVRLIESLPISCQRMAERAVRVEEIVIPF